MTMFNKALAMAAAMSLAAAPAMAAPANPAKLSAGAHASRAATPSQDDSELFGRGAFIAVAGLIAVIVSIIIIASNDDKPNSP